MGRLSLSKCCLWSINSLTLTWGPSWDCNTKNDLIHFFLTLSCIVRVVVVIGYCFLIGGKHLSWCPRLPFLIFLNNLFFFNIPIPVSLPSPLPVLHNFPTQPIPLFIEDEAAHGSQQSLSHDFEAKSIPPPPYLDWAKCPYVGNWL